VQRKGCAARSAVPATICALLLASVFLLSSNIIPATHPGTSESNTAEAPIQDLPLAAVAQPSLRGYSDNGCLQSAVCRTETGLDCRACYNGMTNQQFCKACRTQGLNDVGCRSCPTDTVVLMGGDADVHGCRPSAGYRWCEAKSSCIRPWEKDLYNEGAFAGQCEEASSGKALETPAVIVGGDVDKQGCIPSAGYRWCDDMSSCIRPWEHGMDSASAFASKCERSAAKRQCNCPPTEVVYPCTQEEYEAIKNGTDCAYYRHQQ